MSKNTNKKNTLSALEEAELNHAKLGFPSVGLLIVENPARPDRPLIKFN